VQQEGTQILPMQKERGVKQGRKDERKEGR
jgi:hypothetical protein